MANPNFDVNATFAIEQVLPTKFQFIAENAHPFLAKIIGKQNTLPEGDWMVTDVGFGGTKLIMPVSLELPANGGGVTHAGMWTDETITQPASGEASHAQYEIASYRGGVHLDPRDQRLLSDNPQSRAGLNIFRTRAGNMVAKFKNLLETDISSATADTEAKVLGMRFGLSTSASPGNISQTTHTNWAAGVEAVGAAYTMARVLRGINGTRKESTDGLRMADCMFASELTSGFIFSAIQNDIGANTVISDQVLGNFGHTHFVLQGNTAVVPQRVATKENYFFRSENWAYIGDTSPVMVEPSPQRSKGSSIIDWQFTWMTAVGCNDWSRQAKQTGMSTS